MDLTLYGICFNIRGSLDLLNYVQSNTPVPIETMQQVMDQMDTVTEDELDFAKKMQTNWKKAINKKVPLTMNVADDGGYEITGSIPGELLETVHILTGLESSKIVEEYTADYLKNICGIDASIISVDVEKHEDMSIKTEPVDGFDIGDLSEEPKGPTFEDISTFDDIETEIREEPVIEPEIMEVPEPAKEPEVMDIPEPVEKPEIPDAEEMDAEPEIPEVQEMVEGPETEMILDAPEEVFEPEESAFEEGYMGDDELSYEENYDVQEPEIAVETKSDNAQVMENAMAGIYKELVTNIRDRELDTRLNLKIGQ